MQNTENAGKLVLRVAVAVLLLLHGIAKLSHGPGHIEQLLANAGLPTFIAWGVYLGEVAAPLLLILGVWTRLASAAVALTMLTAVYLNHRPDISVIAPSGGWALELQGLYFFGAIAIFLLGPGAYRIKRRLPAANS